MKITAVGVDIAKHVFQLHWIESETGEIISKPIKRSGFLAHFANRAPCLIGMESVWWRPALGAPIDRNGSSSQADVWESGESVCEW